MSHSDERYIAELREHALKTRMLLSNAQKSERERMVVLPFCAALGSRLQTPRSKPVR